MHSFGLCPHWAARRHVVCESLGLDTALVRSWDVMYAVLGVDTRSASYRGCLDFVDAVVCSAEFFWKHADKDDRQQHLE